MESLHSRKLILVLLIVKDVVKHVFRWPTPATPLQASI